MNLEYKPSLIAQIDIKAFRNNINIIRKMFPGSMIILPVKANAYGHGDLIISKEAVKIGIEYLAVARLSEGLRLRQNNIKLPIIDLGAEYSGNIKLALLNNIELSVHSLENAGEINSYAQKLKKKAFIHLKTDTGMRRLGASYEDTLKIAELINKSEFLHFKSLYTHYAKSFDDQDYTIQQTEEFLKIHKTLSDKGLIPDFCHSCNSGAIIKPPSPVIKNAVRPGIMSYGYFPSDRVKNIGLLPVMTLKSKIIQIKEIPAGAGVSYNHTYISGKNMTTAAIPLGYGDGFPRILSNRLKVTVNKKNYDQIGTISMDLTVIKADKSIKVGDEVLIFGKKSECINDAADLAKAAGTISYEITTLLNDRVARICKERS